MRRASSFVLDSLTKQPPSKPWECGNPEGISKEGGKRGKPALWLSTLSTLCHFHGLPFRERDIAAVALTRYQVPRVNHLVKGSERNSQWLRTAKKTAEKIVPRI